MAKATSSVFVIQLVVLQEDCDDHSNVLFLFYFFYF